MVVQSHDCPGVIVGLRATRTRNEEALDVAKKPIRGAEA